MNIMSDALLKNSPPKGANSLRNIDHLKATARALSADESFSPGELVGRNVRHQSDVEGFKHRFHDARLHQNLAPASVHGSELFDLLEQERFMACGYVRYPGAFKHLPKGIDSPFTSLVTYLRHGWGRKRGSLPSLPPQLENLGRDLLRHRLNQQQFALTLAEFLKNQPVDEEVEETPSGEESEGESVTPDTTPGGESLETTAKIADSTTQQTVSKDTTSDTTPFESLTPPWTLEGEDFDLGVYHVYTRQFDQVVQATSLVGEGEHQNLKEKFDEQLELANKSRPNRLINRLRRVLQSRSLRRSIPDQEEGTLNPQRLVRVMTSPLRPLIYRHVEEAEDMETTVSLLIDNSGSMRGRPITLAAISAYLLADTLERCGVSVEILGFTTSEWNGGKSRQNWMKKGSPPHPGRLNDLLHIIYKDAATPWRRARSRLSLMLKDGLLKENIDGESLLWAYHRLQARPAPRKILIVISDGAPVDDSTLANNPGDFLEHHLHHAIETISLNRDVQLIAIGIGHDVSRYYPNATTLASAEQLGSVLFENLITYFESAQQKRPSRGERRF